MPARFRARSEHAILLGSFLEFFFMYGFSGQDHADPFATQISGSLQRIYCESNVVLSQWKIFLP